jgi:molybdopterin synthase catalytic subunit
VRFFGPARDIVGLDRLELPLEPGLTVGCVAGLLSERFPRLGSALGVRLAVNRAYVPMNLALAAGDEVAVIPPVSGGAPLPRVRITREPIDTAALTADLRRNDAGAVVVFEGTVRAEAESGRILNGLEYHAYEEMAREQLEEIRRRAVEKFGLLDAAIVHRLGRLRLGETSIAVVVVSGHRPEAFDACRWVVDAVKTDVPIWKQNLWADGSQQWVDPACS